MKYIYEISVRLSGSGVDIIESDRKIRDDESIQEFLNTKNVKHIKSEVTETDIEEYEEIELRQV